MPKFMRGQWVIVYPGPSQIHEPFEAQVADIDEGESFVHYHLICPGDPAPFYIVHEDNMEDIHNPR